MDETTIGTYNQLARSYEQETADFWDHFPPAVLNYFFKLVKGRVLDIGSGPGKDGLLLQRAGLQVICLDASEEMIKISAAKGLTSLLGDFNTLPFADGSFDGVWAYTSLLHVPKADVRRPLVEICRVLRDGAILGLGMLEGTHELYRESSGVSLPRWFSFYSEPELNNLLLESGLQSLFVHRFQYQTKTFLNFIAKKGV